MTEETFWDTTKPVGSPDYLRLLVASLRLCETGGDMADLADKIERDIPTRDTQVPSHRTLAMRAEGEEAMRQQADRAIGPARNPGLLT